MAKGSADKATAAEEPVQLKTPAYVQYVGTSDVRGLTRGDFANVGVDHPDVWWHRGNGWKVPLSEISDSAYTAAMERDAELILVEDGPKEPTAEG